MGKQDAGLDASTEPSGDEGFLTRWSQRKLEPETPAPPQASALEPSLEPDPVELVAAPPAPLTDADMPALDSLDEQSDFSGFLSPEVSDGLRKLALRKLFAQASFNVCDGLDDYAEDFTSFEPLGDLVTHEMRRVLERSRKALEEATEPAEQALEADAAEPVAGAQDPAPAVAGKSDELPQAAADETAVATPGPTDSSTV